MKPSSLLRHAVFMTSLLCCACPLHADDASKRTKATELIGVMHIEQSVNALLNQQGAQVQKAVAAMSSQGKLTADQQKDTDAFMQKELGIIRDSLSWQKLKPQIAEIYANAYTEQDLDGLLAFYHSPLGQKLIQTQPEITRQSQGLIGQHLQEMQPKMRDAFEQFKKEMQVKYPNLK